MMGIRKIAAYSQATCIGELTVEIARLEPWKIVVSGLGFDHREFRAADLFDALLDLRRELEKAQVRLICAGARRDVWPSGMSRAMGGGRKAYIMRLGHSPTDHVDIFDDVDWQLAVSVDDQKEFYQKWKRSLPTQ